jgi:hypothetical protein
MHRDPILTGLNRFRKAQNIMGRSTDALAKLMIKELPNSHGTSEQTFTYIRTLILDLVV